MQGLLPPRETSLQAEIDRAHAAISRCCTPLDKYQVSRQGTLTGVQRISPLSLLPPVSCMRVQELAMRHLPAEQQIPTPVAAGCHGAEGGELGHLLWAAVPAHQGVPAHHLHTVSATLLCAQVTHLHEIPDSCLM